MTAQSLTYADIQAAILDGKINDAQGQQLWAGELAKLAAATAVDTVKTQKQLEALDAEIGRYRDAVPGVATEGTPERARVTAEFARLKSLGFPDAVQTELAALQAIYGPAAALSKKTEAAPEPAPQEDIGGAAPEKGKAAAQDGPPSDFSADEKRFYTDLISKGVVKSWADARDMVSKHGSKRLRAKHG